MTKAVINVPTAGLRLDQEGFNFPGQYITEHLNGVVSEDYPTVGNEPGNGLKASLNYPFTGHIDLQDKKKLVFSTDETTSEIGLYDGSTYIVLIKSTGLNFSLNNPEIKGYFRVQNGCETVVYFNDYTNPDRSINIDRLNLYTLNGVTPSVANDLDQWDVNEMKLQPDLLNGEVTGAEVLNSGGLLELGAYHFAIEILDDNLNSIGIGPVSSPVIIYDDGTNESYDNITGGYNQDVFSIADGGVPNTNKSIVLTLDNLDTRFTYARLWIIRKSSGDGVAFEVFKKGDVFTTQQTSYTFTGISAENGDTGESLEQILISRGYYESSYHMLQVDNRMVRSRLKNMIRDFSGYQRAVNEYTLKWVSAQAVANDTSSPGNPKNPDVTLSFMGDEIYAFAVQFIYSSGEFSPAFHLPGRASTSFDTELLVVGTDVDQRDVIHLDVNAGDSIERWKVFNTADSSGRMGYHESASGIYPTLKDCNEEYIYGDLQGQPVRHHKMPDRRLLRTYERDFTNNRTLLNLIGVQLENVTYPDTDIIGHRLLAVRRTVATKTVLDTGVLAGFDFLVPEGSELVSIAYNEIEEELAVTDEYGFLFTPEQLMYRSYLNGDHLKFLGRLSLSSDGSEREEFDKDGGGKITIITNKRRWDNFYLSPARTNIAYDRNIFVEPRTLASVGFTSGGLDLPVYNRSYMNTVNFLRFRDPAFVDQGHYLVSNKVLRDPYSNVSSLIYNPVSRILTLSDDGIVYGGDVAISELRILDFVDIDPGDKYRTSLFEKVWVESSVNYSLRHGGLDCNAIYEPGSRLGQYFIEKVATPTSNGWIARTNACREYYGYNRDYSFTYRPEQYASLPVTHNYCSDCLDNFPNRMVFSLPALNDEAGDAQRLFRSEDYVIIGEGTGDISSVHFDKNRMLVRTFQSRFQLAPHPQQVSTDIETAYLTSGDFLSLPPNEMNKVSYGYGGGQNRLDEVNSEFGLFSVDQRKGQIFLFPKGEITTKESGCQQWFRSNLPSNIKKIIPDYPHININREEGIGVITVYDPRFHRFIIYKKDFEPVNWGGIISTAPKDNRVYWNSTTLEFTSKISGTEVVLKTDNKTYFRDRSWVISYYPEYNFFLSFHSYFSYLMSDPDGLLMIRDKDIWEQSERNFCNFFGSKEDWMIEFTASAQDTSTLEALEVYAEISKWNKGTESWEDVDEPVFDRMLISTNRQSTGEQKLVYRNKNGNPYRAFWSNTQKEILRMERNYRISGIRNLAKAAPVIKFDPDYPVLSVSNDDNIDYQRQQHDLDVLRDSFFKIRLYFKPDEDYAATLEISKTKIEDSII